MLGLDGDEIRIQYLHEIDVDWMGCDLFERVTFSIIRLLLVNLFFDRYY